MKPPLHYRLLKGYVKAGLSIYFKKWQNENTHNIPAEGPFIFVANHQNAFLDALLVVCGIKRNPWFLARGDVFNKGWVNTLLTFCRIKPVFRFRDGHSSMRKNERIMNETVELLRKGECVLLFGEGNHNQPWTTRNLQKGFAHLAFQYMEKTQSDIAIIPVGIHYENHDDFRSRVLVDYGKPISMMEVTKNIPNHREKFGIVQSYVAKKLQALILTLPLDDNYEARKNFLLQNRVFKEDMTEQLNADRQLMDAWTISSKGISKKKSSPFRWFNPLYLYGRIMHFIPQSIIDYVVKNKIKDDQFIGSIKLTMGIFIIPLYYLVITLLFFLIFGPLWTIAFLISLPLGGLFAFSQD